MPSALTSPQARTTSARPLRSPLLLGQGTGATTSWRLSQKQPGLGGMRPDARSPREEEGSGPEGRGGEGAGRWRLAPPLRCPPAAPAPFLTVKRTPRTGHRLPPLCAPLPFSQGFPCGHTPPPPGFWSPKSGFRRCLSRKSEAHKRCWGNLLYSPSPQASAGFSTGGPSIREFRSLLHTVSLLSLHCCGAEVLYLSNPKAEIMSDGS